MDVQLPAELEEFVRVQVESGNYNTASEVVRDALWALRDREHLRERREEELRREIQKGIDSGPATPLDFAAIKAKARGMLQRERRATLSDAPARQAS